MVFAIHWHESAMGVHVSPILKPPSTSFPILHYLPEFAQTHAHWVNDIIQPSHPLLSPFSSCPQSLPASESFPFYCFPLFLCIVHLGSLSYLSLLFFGTLHSNGYIFSFSPLPFASLLFSAICKAYSDNHFAFLHFFFFGMDFGHCLLYNVINLI